MKRKDCPQVSTRGLKKMELTDKLPALTEQQLPETINMIGRAFQKDPFSAHIYPDAEERQRRLKLMFAIALRFSFRYGEVSITPEGTGAACWLPPECTTVSFKQLLSIGALQLSLQMGLPAMGRINNSEGYMKSERRRCVPQPHWYLWVLGVDPDNQGQGLGGLLLRSGLERADASALPCYLETMNPANVTLYQKFGFEIAGEGTMPHSNVTMWSMLRPARTHV
jgi:hypothetical protein